MKQSQAPIQDYFSILHSETIDPSVLSVLWFLHFRKFTEELIVLCQFHVRTGTSAKVTRATTLFTEQIIPSWTLGLPVAASSQSLWNKCINANVPTSIIITNSTFGHTRPGKIEIRPPSSFLTTLAIQGYKVSSCEQRKLWSDCAYVQADLSHRWAYLSEGTFSSMTAHILHFQHVWRRTVQLYWQISRWKLLRGSHLSWESGVSAQFIHLPENLQESVWFPMRNEHGFYWMWVWRRRISNSLGTEVKLK